MPLIRLSDKKEFTEHEFRLEHSNVSFGPQINYSDFGYEVVFPLPKPAHNEVTEYARRIPAALIEGQYYEAWEVVPRFDDYTDENGVLHTRAEQEAEAIAKDTKEKAAQALASAKAARHAEVEVITVTTTSGRVFDGNEDAQNRMSRAVNAMEDADTLPWVLADNTIAQVTRAELREALKLAGAAMAEIWVRPYL